MKSNGEPPAVLLPIETTTRELDSKLVLASALAGKGCRVVVGHKEAVEWIGRRSKKVVWQGKDAFLNKAPPTSREHFADRLASSNSAVMFIQDEGGIFSSEGWAQTVLSKHRTDYIRERRLSRVCAWGERQKDLLAQNGVPARDIAVTGCPRFDLCSRHYLWINNAQIPRENSRRRPYVLMCTRFTSVVHFTGPEKFFLPPSTPRPQGVTNSRFSTWQRDVHDFADFVVLVKEIAACYSEFDVVLRPHPSENVALYSKAFAPFENVIVSRVGSALDWIRSAELVVHCNCTTGIEAVLAGRPVLNLLPTAVPRDNLDKEVAKEAGLAAHSVEDALQKAGILLGGHAPAQVWSSRARSILNNLNGDSIPLLVDQVLSVIREHGIDSSRVRLPPGRKIRGLVRRVVSRPHTAGYVASKRAAFCREHIEMILDGCRMAGTGSARIREFVPNFVVIDPL